MASFRKKADRPLQRFSTVIPEMLNFGLVNPTEAATSFARALGLSVRNANGGALIVDGNTEGTLSLTVDEGGRITSVKGELLPQRKTTR